MSLYEKIIKKEEKIALVGLGYVGMPIAVEFAKHVDVIGFDIKSLPNEILGNSWMNDSMNDVSYLMYLGFHTWSLPDM